MGLVDQIKADVKKSGQNKGKFIYFREGQKTRIRFLQDIDDGLQITFHDSYERGINVPCQEHFGRDCPYCGDDSLRTRSLYVWSVYNYEANEVQLFMFAVNNCSPIPALLAMYETYGPGLCYLRHWQAAEQNLFCGAHGQGEVPECKGKTLFREGCYENAGQSISL